MTEVTFNAKEMRIVAENHAGDTNVCAGISALMGALAKSLDDSKYMLDGEPVIVFDEAKAEIACKPLPIWKDYIFRSYWTILEGVMLIHEKYPEACDFGLC